MNLFLFDISKKISLQALVTPNTHKRFRSYFIKTGVGQDSSQERIKTGDMSLFQLNLVKSRVSKINSQKEGFKDESQQNTLRSETMKNLQKLDTLWKQVTHWERKGLIMPDQLILQINQSLPNNLIRNLGPMMKELEDEASPTRIRTKREGQGKKSRRGTENLHQLITQEYQGGHVKSETGQIRKTGHRGPTAIDERDSEQFYTPGHGVSQTAPNMGVSMISYNSRSNNLLHEKTETESQNANLQEAKDAKDAKDEEDINRNQDLELINELRDSHVNYGDNMVAVRVRPRTENIQNHCADDNDSEWESEEESTRSDQSAPTNSYFSKSRIQNQSRLDSKSKPDCSNIEGSPEVSDDTNQDENSSEDSISGRSGTSSESEQSQRKITQSERLDSKSQIISVSKSENVSVSHQGSKTQSSFKANDQDITDFHSKSEIQNRSNFKENISGFGNLSLSRNKNGDFKNSLDFIKKKSRVRRPLNVLEELSKPTPRF